MRNRGKQVVAGDQADRTPQRGLLVQAKGGAERAGTRDEKGGECFAHAEVEVMR